MAVAAPSDLVGRLSRLEAEVRAMRADLLGNASAINTAGEVVTIEQIATAPATAAAAQGTANTAQTAAQQATAAAVTAVDQATVAINAADGKSRIFTQATAPTNATAPGGLGAADVNDLWVDTSAGRRLNTWDGTQWVQQVLGATALAADAIDGKVITGATFRTAATGQRVQIDSAGLRAYPSAGTTPNTTIDSATGLLTAAGATIIGVIQTAASGPRVIVRQTTADDASTTDPTDTIPYGVVEMYGNSPYPATVGASSALYGGVTTQTDLVLRGAAPDASVTAPGLRLQASYSPGGGPTRAAYLESADTLDLGAADLRNLPAPGTATSATRRSFVDAGGTDSGWVTLTPPAPTTGTLRWRKLGRWVELDISIAANVSWAASFTLATLAAAALPLTAQVIAGWWNNYVPAFARLTTAGVLTVEQAAATARTSFTAVWAYPAAS